MADESATPVMQGEEEEVDLNASNSNSDGREEAKQPLNDDLFFSTISDPNTNDEVSTCNCSALLLIAERERRAERARCHDAILIGHCCF
jgi:hypothetical protein